MIFIFFTFFHLNLRAFLVRTKRSHSKRNSATPRSTNLPPTPSSVLSYRLNATALSSVIMHIKQITLSGFKSYRDETVVGPFSPGHNVVVGRNGSGKSNFFDAVRFVLSDTFSSLRAEERVALLHEGAGTSVLSAYVEMIFDNSDGRLPSERDEVALRRMVGLKKDEYLLDRKNVTKTEVFNLLESAGFSRSNPYYIVQQGKVAALCAMSDKQRLDLLQEVAGTRVYDERREESLKIMEETDAKREKITEVIDYIEKRLAELESEKEELRDFQRLDKERKALEYTMHVRELEEAKAALEALEGDNAEHRSKADELQARLVALRASKASNDRDMKALAPELRRCRDERDAVDAKRKEAIDKVAKLQVDVAEADNLAKNATETVANVRSELTQVEELISNKREQLQPLEEQFHQLKREEMACRKRIEEHEAKILRLRVKANRTNQFPNVQARDAHLKKTIREMKKKRSASASQIATIQRDIGRLERQIEKNEAKKVENKREVQELLERLNTTTTELDPLRQERDALDAKRKDGWRKEEELKDNIRRAEAGLGRLEAAKRSALGAGAYTAVEAVMRASHEDPRNLGPGKVFGAVVDLIEVDSKFSQAADVTAGSALTYIVVDSDDTAARLVRIMQAKRAGRVTFIPLNRLEVDQRPPPASTADSIPLVSKVACEDRFRGAVKQIFGRTLVTRTVEIAAQLSKQHGVDCVTLEGDQVNKRGAMTGGYMDISRSRIDAARFLREARTELAGWKRDARLLREEVAVVEGNLSRVLGELQRREALQRTTNSTVARLRGEIANADKYISADRNNIPRAHERISFAEEAIANADRSIEDAEAELRSPMVSGLSGSEESTMEELKSQLQQLKRDIGPKVAQRAKLERSVVSLRSELNENLERRAAELKQSLRSTMPDDSMPAKDDEDAETIAQNSLREKLGYLREAESHLDSIKKSIVEKNNLLEQKVKQYEKLETDVERERDEEAKINKALDEDRQQVENRYNRKAVETQKKADSEKSIRELGSLPADFDKYRGLSVNILMTKLRKVNQSLQKYSHVNKKAIDQFVSFTEQRDTLTRRREELDSGAAAIRQLIESLDQRKDEDILRTYKGVTKFFCEVFSELVPGGKASLVMLKSSGDSRKRRDNDEDTLRIQYTGVAMKVSFSSTGQAYLLQQLSGGQKSIVALALIFAIQRLDPAPFYLFDEIDANLDATHRQAVANLIRKQANSGTQFVTTTFRPELVNAGDLWYGVTHKKKVSTVQEVDKDVALTFIIDEPVRT